MLFSILLFKPGWNISIWIFNFNILSPIYSLAWSPWLSPAVVIIIASILLVLLGLLLSFKLTLTGIAGIIVFIVLAVRPLNVLPISLLYSLAWSPYFSPAISLLTISIVSVLIGVIKKT